MIDFQEWRQLNEVELHKEPWGYEISGTVAEVMKVLAQAPPHKECIASVTFGSHTKKQTQVQTPIQTQMQTP